MSETLKWTLSAICNGTVTVWMCILLIRKIRQKEPGFFRYFTTLSNIFAMIGCAVILPFSLTGAIRGGVVIPHAFSLMKYVSAVSVCVTLLTVLFFLGPVQGYDKMLGGEGLYLHLIGPVLAVVSCCLLEKGWTWAEGVLGMLPTVIYGTVYYVQVMERKKWEDFYGYNRGGRWYISVLAMVVGTALICLGMTAAGLHTY